MLITEINGFHEKYTFSFGNSMVFIFIFYTVFGELQHMMLLQESEKVIITGGLIANNDQFIKKSMISKCGKVNISRDVS